MTRLTFRMLSVAASCAMVASVSFAETPSPATDYIDPSFASRNRCMASPARPAWVMVQPVGYEWRTKLALQWASLRAATLVVEAADCNCDMLYPDWEKSSDEVTALWESVSVLPQSDWSQTEKDSYYKISSDLLRSAGPGLRSVGRLCSSLE